MSPDLLYFGALILGLAEEIQARGRSLVGWSAVLITVGLLTGVIRL